MVKIEIIKRRYTKNLLHIYNRGNRKQMICKDLKYYSFLYNLIKHSFRVGSFDLLSFCIMPNHYHILAQQQGPSNIGAVMQKIGCGYTKYFNIKHSLSGHLFQGTYKYKPVTNYYQLKIISTYIKENPQNINLPTRYPYFFTNKSLTDHHLLAFLK
jgi:putative transposase